MEETNRTPDTILDFIKNAPSTIDKGEEVTRRDIEHERKVVELSCKKEELEGIKQDRKQRGKFSIWIFAFMGIYMFLVLSILVFAGLRILLLSDTVLVALMTTTTADVIGIFIIVAKYLFHKSEN